MRAADGHMMYVTDESGVSSAVQCAQQLQVVSLHQRSRGHLQSVSSHPLPLSPIHSLRIAFQDPLQLHGNHILLCAQIPHGSLCRFQVSEKRNVLGHDTIIHLRDLANSVFQALQFTLY